MLVLRRAPDESLVIGDEYLVTVTAVSCQQVTLQVRFAPDIALRRHDPAFQPDLERSYTLSVHESLLFGDHSRLTIIDAHDHRTRIGIDVPTKTSVHRLEVYEAIRKVNA
ncbi:MAG TPA: carbon storage regulator [Planctomycetaceae bacterium]|nr:carbon storage regulator [Planctomycetaceae bacterium]